MLFGSPIGYYAISMLCNTLPAFIVTLFVSGNPSCRGNIVALKYITEVSGGSCKYNETVIIIAGEETYSKKSNGAAS